MKINATIAGAILVAISGLANAGTVLDLVEKQIERKSEEVGSKGLGSTQFSVPPVDTSSPGSRPPLVTAPEKGSAQIDDLKITAIVGVGRNLRAKASFKEAQLELSAGSSVSGMTVVAITPISVVFEENTPCKKPKCGRKVAYLNSSAQSADASGVGR